MMNGVLILQGKQKSLADKFEYVMHGLLYKMSEDKEKQNDGSNTVKVYDIYALSPEKCICFV